jgi:glucosyl-3-phosphoglycerate phosphatase
MIRLIVWRHGRTEWNATGRVQGQADVDLDDAGLAQAVTAAPRLAALDPAIIVSSDLIRAMRTAQVLARLVGLPIDPDPRLRERDFGPWQGLTSGEIQHRYPDDFARWGTTDPIREPAIETLDELAKRAGAAFRDAALRLGQGVAVLVTHGGAARVGCGGLLGWPASLWSTLGALGNCHYTELRHTDDRGWQLRAHNVG